MVVFDDQLQLTAQIAPNCIDFVNGLSQNCDKALIELNMLVNGDEKSAIFKELETALTD